jgi:putative ABC transport system substrate-binding protein
MSTPMRVHALFFDTPQARAPMLAQLRAGIAAQGWSLGQDVVLEEHYAQGSEQRMDEIARDVAQRRPDAIVVAGTMPAVAAHKATREIPIVMVGVGDPVSRGLIASFERPGGNVTGSSDQAADAALQRIGFIAALLGGAPRIGIAGSLKLVAPGDWEAAARQHGCSVQFIDTPAGKPLLESLRAAALHDIGALFVVPSPVSFAVRAQIAEMAREFQLPLVFGWREFMDAGAPAGCGPNLTRLYADVAPLLARIRAGEPVGSIPAVRPRFERWLRASAWQALGRPVPERLLREVDEVIDG